MNSKEFKNTMHPASQQGDKCQIYTGIFSGQFFTKISQLIDRNEGIYLISVWNECLNHKTELKFDQILATFLMLQTFSLSS